MVEEKEICKSQDQKIVENWSKINSCMPNKYFEPTSIHEIKQVLQQAALNGKHVRCVGGKASPSRIFCTSDYIMSMEHFNNVINIDTDNKTITVESGATLNKINESLHERGLALPVLPAIGSITIGGILGTGVHGSGVKNKILPDYVIETELVTANCSTYRCNMEENKDIFLSSLVNIGALGVVTSVKIQCVDAYKLKQTTTSYSFSEALKLIQEKRIESSDYGKFHYFPNLDRVVIFDINKTNDAYKPPQPSMLWQVLRKTGLLETFFFLFIIAFKSFRLIAFKLLHYMLYNKKTEFVDDSFRVLHFDCLFSQHVSEWAIPQENMYDFLEDLRNCIKGENILVHDPIEFRIVKSGNAFLGQTYNRDSTYINIIMFRPFGFDPDGKDAYWKVYEDLCLKYHGKPHWAKTHKMGSKFFKNAYPKFEDFLSVREKLDPNRLFVNDYIRNHILD